MTQELVRVWPRKAEPGAKRSGATGSPLNNTQRPRRLRLFVATTLTRSLRFAPGSALRILLDV